jgi:hypothetical protein
MTRSLPSPSLSEKLAELGKKMSRINPAEEYTMLKKASPDNRAATFYLEPVPVSRGDTASVGVPARPGDEASDASEQIR